MQFQKLNSTSTSQLATVSGVISKALGISSLVYSMSNIDNPKEIIPDVQSCIFIFYGITNKINVKGHAFIRSLKKVAYA